MVRHRQTGLLFPLFFFCFLSFFGTHSSEAAEREKTREDAGKSRFPTLQQGCSLKLLGNRDYFPALKEAIEGARKEIVMSFYLFKTEGHAGNDPEAITKCLLKAAARGIRIEILLERGKDTADQVYVQNRETMEKLAGKGIHVHFDSPRTTTHTKLAVIDGRYTFIGSHNLTQAALKYNNELSVLIDSADVAEEALNYIRTLH